MALRPGFHDWHNESCSIKFGYERKGVRGYWCHTHNQWAYEFAKIVYVFDHENH